MTTRSIPTPASKSTALRPDEDDDPVLSSLQDFVVKHKILLSPSLAFRRVPGRGLGIYSTARLRSGERIMHVPSSALLTPASIPPGFAGKELRSKLPVHVLLAAYIAFGMTEEKKQELEPWMATWPKMHDFTASMCVCWPEGTRKPVTLRTSRAVKSGIASKVHKDSETTADRVITFQPVPQNLTGSWLPTKEDIAFPKVSKPKILDLQFAKLESHISLASAHFPSHLPALGSLPSASPELTNFAHAWANVNTRCFYHVAPGKRAPKDSNEAMALVPVMDLFNHTHVPNCKTSYDRKGFYVATGEAIRAGQELLLSYGAHGNDVLWTEYGFMMDANGDDSVSGFDEVVLDGLTTAEKVVLEGAGYLGNYTLTAEGLCWRSEVVCWLGLLSRNQWFRFIEGTLTPETVDRLHLDNMRAGTAKRRKGNDTTIAAQVDAVLPSAKAREKQIRWLSQMKAQAEVSLDGLTLLGQAATEKDMLGIFADAEEALTAQGLRGARINDLMQSQAKQRLGMCLQRWTQVLEICHAGIVRLKQSRVNGVSEDGIEDVQA